MVRLLQLPRPVNTDRNTTPTPLPGAACHSYESRRSGVALLLNLHARTRALSPYMQGQGPLHARTNHPGHMAPSPSQARGVRPPTDTAPSHAPMRCAYAPGGRGPLDLSWRQALGGFGGSQCRPWGPWTAPRWAATKLHRTSKRRA